MGETELHILKLQKEIIEAECSLSRPVVETDRGVWHLTVAEQVELSAPKPAANAANADGSLKRSLSNNTRGRRAKALCGQHALAH